MNPMLLLHAIACADPDADESKATSGDTTEPCVGLPALGPAPEGFEPVLGAGALVVFGEICEPSTDRVPVFTWSISEAPDAYAFEADDLVTYQDAEHAEALFTPDVAGTYVVEVTVADPEGHESAPGYFVETIEAAATPVADCGGDLSVRVGETAWLDGTASYDPSGWTLAYAWQLEATPADSILTNGDLGDPAAETASLTPDVPGTFVVSLTVTDEEGASAQDRCVVTAR